MTPEEALEKLTKLIHRIYGEKTSYSEALAVLQQLVDLYYDIE